ncbi:transposase family protein [Acinetobacter nematophilus]|uniref:DDE Tnp4 domain-containing protein n=1 Tax=Acinetobacter nematophilus TaxID=2994642 RepID=A0A9X3DWF5_9GAMM|nr:transposase family protein [Acinetobacter nematophilus]MCX5466349.1 hypothetical protein [Acinetobacter nematophilus]
MFNLSKDILKGEDIDWDVVLVDVTETPIQRPKKQKKSYSGKKKLHIFKGQAIIHSKTQQILSLCMSKGVVRDFELFKRSFH